MHSGTSSGGCQKGRKIKSLAGEADRLCDSGNTQKVNYSILSQNEHPRLIIFSAVRLFEDETFCKSEAYVPPKV